MSNILGIIFANKKSLVSIFGLVLFLSLIPLHFAEADIPVIGDIVDAINIFLNYVMTLPFRILAAIIALGLFLLSLAAGFIFFLVIALLNWMITASLRVGITPANPIPPEVVNVGWTFSRDFVNMLFILILVFIGLATILKIREYEAKKILPLLIIIALLVNFSAVIVGFIVDMGNIVTKFFIDAAGDASREAFTGIWDRSWDFLESIWDIFGAAQLEGVIGQIIAVIIYGIVLILFYLFATLIYFVVMLIFFFRIIILWILTILAPLAFAAYILPSTRTWWSKWWQQLIQWSIIGIPIGFFLYLSNLIMTNMDATTIFGDPSFTGAEGLIDGAATEVSLITTLIVSLLAPTVALVLLFVGVLLSIQMAPSNASGIINLGKSIPGKLAKTRMGQKTLGGLAKGTQKALARTSPFMRRMEERAGKVPGIGKALRPLTALTTRPIGLASKGINRLAGPGLIQYAAEREKITTPKGFEAWSGPQQEAWAEVSGLSSKDRLAVADKMGDNLEYTSKDFQDKIKADATSALLKRDPSYQKEAKAVAKTFPDIITEAILTNMKSFGKTGEAETEAIEKVKESLETTIKHISDALSDEDLAIEAGLKLKYITKKMVSDDRNNAAGEADKKLTDDEKEKFLRDTAAGANYIREFKGSDIGKMADTKNLAARTGLVLGNSANLQRVRDEHGMAALEDVFDGPGGLNSMADAPEKLEKFYEKNPNMVRALMTNPALRQMNWEGRNQMTDPNGQKTTNFGDFERRIIMEEKLKQAPPALKSYYESRNAVDNHQRRIEVLEMRGEPTAQRERLLNLDQNKANIYWKQIEKDESSRNKWVEIEKIRDPQQATMLQKNIEAGLRIEGILNAEPLLSKFDNLHRITRERNRKKMKAAKEARNQDALYWSNRETSASNKIRLIQNEINQDNRLKKKWEEIEKLRRP